MTQLLVTVIREEVRQPNKNSGQPTPAGAARVSFVVVAHDEAACLPVLLQDLLAQDYPATQIEILLVAAPSSDGTENLMEEFRAAHPERCIRVLRNPGGILATGWNVALAAATGDVIVRVDAHTRIAPSFISRTAAAVENGACIAGGQRQTILPARVWPRLLAIAEASKFGSGAADYRNVHAAGYVDTVAHAAYRREVFSAVGGYDERLARNQDNEIHYRMRKAGYRFWYSPEIQSQHFARSTLRGMLRQKYGNGLWIGLTMGIQPRCFSLRHFIPLLFVLSLAAGLGCGLWWNWFPLLTLLGLYAAAAVGFTAREMIPSRAASCRCLAPLLPVVFFLMHGAYGVGTMVGLAGMPWFWYANRDYKLPWPIPKTVDKSVP